MATIPLSDPITNTNQGAWVKSTMWLWEAVGDADVGEPLEIPGLADRTVQLVGSFGSATIVIQGSLDGTNWVTLEDLAGDPLSFTEAGLAVIQPIVRYLRPSSANGTATDVDVYILARQP